jgi:hypothetical protein
MAKSSKKSEAAPATAHKAAVAGQALFGRGWDKLSAEQRDEARQLVSDIQAASKEPAEA